MCINKIKIGLTVLSLAMGISIFSFASQVNAQEVKNDETTTEEKVDASVVLKKSQAAFSTKKIFKISAVVDNSKKANLTYNLDKKIAYSEADGKKEYIDFKNKLVYTYNNSLKRFQVEPIPSSDLETFTDFSSIYSLDSTLQKMLLNLNLTSSYAGEGSITRDGKQIDCYKINIETDLSNLFSSQSNVMGTNLGITAKVSSLVYIGKSDYNVYFSDSKIEISFLGYSEIVNVKVDFSYPTSFSFPAAIKKAQLAKGLMIKKSGLTYRVDLKKKNAVLTLVSIGNKKTINAPKTIKKYGKKYKVTKVEKALFKHNLKIKKVVLGNNIKSLDKKAFTGAKNLKKLKIKNKKLRKKVKKNKKKYGLSKKVKVY